MIPKPFYWGLAATGPAIEATLSDENDKVVDLTGATVTFVMKASFEDTSTLISAVADIDPDPTTGVVSYTPTSSDTASRGQFAGYWMVVDRFGVVQFYPTPGYHVIEIGAR